MAFAVALLGMALVSGVTPARADTADVRISNLAFNPETVTVEGSADDDGVSGVHAHVNWHMDDPGVEHTVAFDDPSVASSSGRLAAGQVYNAVFEAPGTYTYRCEIHPEMTGTVVVRFSPGDQARDGGSGSGAAVVAAAAAIAVATIAALLLLRRRSSRRTAS